MRDFKGMKRQRSRNRNGGSGGGGGGGGGKPQHNTTRAFDSTGPEGVKVRGAAQHVYEKYQQLARDAHTAGDRVLAENYLQHAEHYFRMLRAMQPQRPLSEIIGRDQFVSGYDIDFEDESGGQDAADNEPDAEVVEPAEGADRQPRNYSDNRREAENRREERPRDDYRQNDSRGRDEQPRQDRYQNDRTQVERSQNDRFASADRGGAERGFNDRPQAERVQGDRYQGDRNSQNDRSRGDRQQGDRLSADRAQGERPRDDRGAKPFRDDRPRFPRAERSERPDRDPLGVTEPEATPLTGAPPSTTESGPVLRADDGDVSHAPAFLQVRAAEPRGEGEDEPRKPRRRRAPRSFESTGDGAATAVVVDES